MERPRLRHRHSSARAGRQARLGVPRTPVGIPTSSPQASAEDLGRRGRCIIHAPWARSSMAEQLTLNQRVEGSSPSGLTTRSTHEMTRRDDPGRVARSNRSPFLPGSLTEPQGACDNVKSRPWLPSPRGEPGHFHSPSGVVGRLGRTLTSRGCNGFRPRCKRSGMVGRRIVSPAAPEPQQSGG
jgi:hypothetical protein